MNSTKDLVVYCGTTVSDYGDFFQRCAEFPEWFDRMVALDTLYDLLGGFDARVTISDLVVGMAMYRRAVIETHPELLSDIDDECVAYLKGRSNEHEGNQETRAENDPPGNVEPGRNDPAADGHIEATGGGSGD